MKSLIADSPLLERFPRRWIPNGVDTRIFRLIDKDSVRTALGIPGKARVALFLAHVAQTGTRKGGEYVNRVMEKVAASGVKNLVLIVMGLSAETWAENDTYSTTRIGFTNSDRLLAAVYSSADVIIHPALAENFPNSILESMACGTPAVAFDTGGVGRFGYLHIFLPTYLLVGSQPISCCSK